MTKTIFLFGIAVLLMLPLYGAEAAIKPNFRILDTNVEGILADGQILTLSGFIKNDGDSPTYITTVAYFRINGSRLSERTVSPLSAGQSVKYQQAWTASAGSHTMSLCADTTNLVDESNEGDNCSPNFFFTVLSPSTSSGEDARASFIAPRSGAEWHLGKSRHIDWAIFDYTGTIHISLVEGLNNTFVREIASVPAKPAGLNWVVDENIAPANDYKILMRDDNQQEITTSDFITITVAPTSDPQDSRTLLRARGDDKVYRIIGGKRLWIPSPQALMTQNLSFDDVEEEDATEIHAHMPLRLMRATGDKKVYYVTETGLKRWIRTAEVFNSYNNNWVDIVEVDQEVVNSLADSDLVRVEGSTKVYKIEGDEKRWVTSAEAFNRLGLRWNLIAPINMTELASYTEGSPIQ